MQLGTQSQVSKIPFLIHFIDFKNKKHKQVQQHNSKHLKGIYTRTLIKQSKKTWIAKLGTRFLILNLNYSNVSAIVF